MIYLHKHSKYQTVRLVMFGSGIIKTRGEISEAKKGNTKNSLKYFCESRHPNLEKSLNTWL